MVPSEDQIQVEDILVSFREWLSVQEDRWRRDADRNEFHISPSIAPGDPLIDANRRRARLKRQSVGRRVFRTVAWGFIFTVIFIGAFAWQAGDEQTKDMMRGWGISLSRVLSGVRANLSSRFDVAAETIFKTEDQAATTQNVAHLQTSSINLSIPASLATGSLAELQQQLDTIGNNIADVQRVVEKLAARQEQMDQDIATLQWTGQNVIQELSAVSRSPGVHVPLRKNIPRAEPSEAAAKPSVPLTAPSNQAPLYLH